MSENKKDLTPEKEIEIFIEDEFNYHIYKEVKKRTPVPSAENILSSIRLLEMITLKIILFYEQPHKVILWVRGCIAKVAPEGQKWMVEMCLQIAANRIENRSPLFEMIEEELLSTEFDNNQTQFTEEMDNWANYFTDGEGLGLEKFVEGTVRLRFRFRSKEMIVKEFINENRDEIIKQLWPSQAIIQERRQDEDSTSRQVLIMHYFFKYCQVRGIDNTKKRDLIKFLTGKSEKNIYDLVNNPLTTKKGNFRKEDLQFIRPFFEDLGLVEIVKMINNELEVNSF